MALSSFDKKSSALQRLLVGYAEDISLDTAGRLLLSQVLREFAKVERQAMLVGQGSHFELWDKEAWDLQIQNATEQEASSMPIELEGFSL
jgi:MraZ protein